MDSEIKENKGLLRRVAAALAALLCAVALLLGGVLSVGDGGRPLPTDPPSHSDGTVTLGNIVDISDPIYTYEEMTEDLQELAETYPSLLRIGTMGKSADGRELLYCDLGAESPTKRVLITAGIHGREYLTPQLAMRLTEYWLAYYYAEDGDGVSFANLMEGCAFRIVPMVNPDGITLSQQGIDGIRSETLRESIREIYENDCNAYPSYRDYGSLDEYLKYWKANANGVDLNRNFAIEYWEEMRTNIPAPSAQKYKGDAPCSEPETKALSEMLDGLDGLVCALAFHSQGEIIYWDCGQSGALRAENAALVDAMAAATGYEPYDTFNHPDATLEDYCALELGIPSMNLETGLGKCPLPIEQLPTILEQNLTVFRILAEYAYAKE